MTKRTQGEELARLLKAAPHTYWDMVTTQNGLSPWKRVSEWLERHPDWKLRKGSVNRYGVVLTTWRIVRAR